MWTIYKNTKHTFTLHYFKRKQNINIFNLSHPSSKHHKCHLHMECLFVPKFRVWKGITVAFMTGRLDIKCFVEFLLNSSFREINSDLIVIILSIFVCLKYGEIAVLDRFVGEKVLIAN